MSGAITFDVHPDDRWSSHWMPAGLSLIHTSGDEHPARIAPVVRTGRLRVVDRARDRQPGTEDERQRQTAPGAHRGHRGRPQTGRVAQTSDGRILIRRGASNQPLFGDDICERGLMQETDRLTITGALLLTDPAETLQASAPARGGPRGHRQRCRPPRLRPRPDCHHRRDPPRSARRRLSRAPAVGSPAMERAWLEDLESSGALQRADRLILVHAARREPVPAPVGSEAPTSPSTTVPRRLTNAEARRITGQNREEARASHRTHRRSTAVQLTGLVAVMALGSLAAAATTNLPVLAVVLLLSGLVNAPAAIVAYLAADRLVPDSGRTEATTWVSTAHNVGVALGVAGAGIAVEVAGTATALLVGATVLLLTAVATLLARWTLTSGRDRRRHRSPGSVRSPDRRRAARSWRRRRSLEPW